MHIEKWRSPSEYCFVTSIVTTAPNNYSRRIVLYTIPKALNYCRRVLLMMTSEIPSDMSAASPDRPVRIDGTAELDKLVANGGVVLADFYADWCGPCRMLEPIVEKLASDTDATVAKVDVDTNQQLANSFGVRGVPTLVLFADGEQVEKIVGVQSEEQLRSLIESHTN